MFQPYQKQRIHIWKQTRAVVAFRVISTPWTSKKNQECILDNQELKYANTMNFVNEEKGQGWRTLCFLHCTATNNLKNIERKVWKTSLYKYRSYRQDKHLFKDRMIYGRTGKHHETKITFTTSLLAVELLIFFL